MGEIADMMLDGTLCEWCGVLVDEGNLAPGYPRLCAECASEAKKKGFEINKFGTVTDGSEER